MRDLRTHALEQPGGIRLGQRLGASSREPGQQPEQRDSGETGGGHGEGAHQNRNCPRSSTRMLRRTMPFVSRKWLKPSARSPVTLVLKP